MKLVEAFVTLVLGLLVVTATWRVSAAMNRTLRSVESRAASNEARRLAGLILDVDAADAISPSDPAGVDVRAYRWWGVPCAPPARPGRVTVRWWGLRRPDPSKDSVVVVDRSGRRRGRALIEVDASRECPAPALTLTWSAEPFDRATALVRGFERGTYRIDDALRYRRGRGGAQPLTDAVFDPDSVGLTMTDRGVVLEVRPGAPRSWAP